VRRRDVGGVPVGRLALRHHDGQLLPVHADHAAEEAVLGAAGRVAGGQGSRTQVVSAVVAMGWVVRATMKPRQTRLICACPHSKRCCLHLFAHALDAPNN
jgi:hypothetical protein